MKQILQVYWGHVKESIYVQYHSVKLFIVHNMCKATLPIGDDDGRLNIN